MLWFLVMKWVCNVDELDSIMVFDCFIAINTVLRYNNDAKSKIHIQFSANDWFIDWQRNNKTEEDTKYIEAAQLLGYKAVCYFRARALHFNFRNISAKIG